MTWKKALTRGLVGIPIGVTISYAITIILSLIWGQGRYSPAVPALVETVGSQAAAVALQFALSGLMGFAFAIASAIWDVESWSLTRQTICHFLAITLGMMPIVWACHWADYTPGGLLGYFGFFALAYIVIWLVLTITIRAKVRKVNEKLQGK